jgi:hypothetical protein
LLATTVAGTSLAAGQAAIEQRFFDATDHPAIAYATTTADDPVQRLDRDFASGTRRLTRDPSTGYLKSLLQLLDVPESSQVAVFSKTSMQAPVIGPTTPRTIFFNDTTMVAWPSGGFIEIAAQDPRQGIQFYVLDQRPAELPRLIPRPPPCLNCHLSYATLNVPGTLVRSVATGPGGQPLPYLANGITTHRTPMAERWAGWFVTGRRGNRRTWAMLSRRSTRRSLPKRGRRRLRRCLIPRDRVATPPPTATLRLSWCSTTRRT